MNELDIAKKGEESNNALEEAIRQLRRRSRWRLFYIAVFVLLAASAGLVYHKYYRKEPHEIVPYETPLKINSIGVVNVTHNTGDDKIQYLRIKLKDTLNSNDRIELIILTDPKKSIKYKPKGKSRDNYYEWFVIKDKMKNRHLWITKKRNFKFWVYALDSSGNHLLVKNPLVKWIGDNGKRRLLLKAMPENLVWINDC